MSESFQVTTVSLKVDDGTLYATPNGGQVRADNNTDVVLDAPFPFFVEITRLTGSHPLPEGGQASRNTDPKSAGYSFPILLRNVPDVPTAPPAPSFKYTVRGAHGAAAGLVLDTIIIVDKK
jgi:hypothetical protein